jgi:sugar phosphate isomerase/epimerase
MSTLGIEFLSVFGMPPVDYVNLTADLGCRHITVVMEPQPFNPQGYPGWSLRTDLGLRRDLKAALSDRGVSISLAEGFVVFPERDVRDFAADLDVVAELGATRINTLSFDPDEGRTLAQFAALGEMACARGLTPHLEFTPSKKIGRLSIGLEALRQIGNPDFKLLVDTMHFVRGGSWPEEAGLIDPDKIGYIQLCDVPLKPRFDDYVEEAMYERMPPGAGELPLREVLTALPHDRVIGLEIPQRSLAEAGVGPYDRLRPCVEAARRLLAEVG